MTAIERAFNAKVNLQPLDYINEPNLRTNRLALVDDDEPSSTPIASNPARHLYSWMMISPTYNAPYSFSQDYYYSDANSNRVRFDFSR